MYPIIYKCKANQADVVDISVDTKYNQYLNMLSPQCLLFFLEHISKIRDTMLLVLVGCTVIHRGPHIELSTINSVRYITPCG